MTDTSPRLPHVIHIGFPKCASTYLQQWFAAHPQIAYRPGGLAGMYNIYDLIASVLEKSGGARCAVTSAEQISAPVDPASFGGFAMDKAANFRSSIEDVCAKLAVTFPGACILMITRNHTDVLKSSYSELVSHGRLEFDNEAAMFNSQNLKAAAPFDYDHILELYSQHFAGRVLALPYELLVDHEAGFLRHVAQFLDVDAFNPPIGKVNSGLSEDELYYYPRIGTVLRHFALTGLLYRGLSKLHRVMISRGGWKPLIAVMARSKKPRKNDMSVTTDMLNNMAGNCKMLVKSEIYAPYRELYMKKD